MSDDLDKRAEYLVRNEVHLCVSYLVSTLAGGYGAIAWNDASVRQRAELCELCERAFELCSPLKDYEETLRDNGWTQSPEGWWWREPHEGEEADFYFLGSGPFVRSDEMAETICRDYDLEPYQWEIYEHWAVSRALAEDLAKLGERVDMDFAGLCVWGRTTTGQAIHMDGIIRRVIGLIDKRVASL